LISYAQNFEDVMLWRALRHVKSGFYIDIGAQDPVIDSVSLEFYNKGWRGVHVEPTPAYASALREARPDETVIEAAIGDEEPLISIYEIPDTGLSTARKEIAELHIASGFPVRDIRVPCLRLSALFDSCGQRDVHWLKIDVEGMESSVLRSWAPSSVRPWIVLLEATMPRSPEPSFAEWEPIILKTGYRFAYFDGLNRFYISDSHPELLGAFSVPPNVFDGFSLSGTATNGFSNYLNESISTANLRTQTLASEISEANAANANFNQLLVAADKENLSRTIHLREIVELSEQRKKLLEDALRENSQLIKTAAIAEQEHARKDNLLIEQRSEIEQSRVKLADELRQQDRLRKDMHSMQQAMLAQASEYARAMENQISHERLERLELANHISQIESGHERERRLLEEQLETARSSISAASDRLAAAQLDYQHRILTSEQTNQLLRMLIRRLSEKLNRVSDHWTVRVLAPTLRDAARDLTSSVALESAGAPEKFMPASFEFRPGTNMRQLSNSFASPEEILELFDEAFVSAAYEMVLGRTVDSGGLENYLSKIRAGESKEMIVYELATSDEGRARPPKDPGIREFIARCAQLKMPLVSRFLNTLGFSQSRETSRALRAAENRMRMDISNSLKTYSEIELSVAKFAADLVRLTDDVVSRLEVLQAGLTNSNQSSVRISQDLATLQQWCSSRIQTVVPATVGSGAPAVEDYIRTRRLIEGTTINQ
jgi:FkbM family methyltransferase